MFVAVKAGGISGQMVTCQSAMTPGPFSNGAKCYCPATMMDYYKVTLAEITYIMAQKQPQQWASPHKYCGNATLSCAEPKCIPLPR